MIRPAIINDLERITVIYNQAIESRQATSDTQIFTTEQRNLWFSSHNDKRTPIFVYENYGTVVGYCYLSEYRPGRQALASIAEISCFIDFEQHHKGIGSKLIQYTIHTAKELGYRNLLAIILSCNNGSLSLLKKQGFELWGILPNIAYFDDNVYSHYYFGLKL